MINEVNANFPFDAEALLANAVIAAAEYESIVSGEVVVSLVDDERIRELNRVYRQKDTSTDVLSFAIQESLDTEPDIFFPEEEAVDAPLGDIVISVDTAARQAEEYQHSLQRELAFLAVHGFLHLIGYDHMTAEQEKEMFGRQEAILTGIGLKRVVE